MIKDSGKHLFDMMLGWKLDRFARNRYDSARHKVALKKNGDKVVSATEVISDGAEGVILESVLEGYAEYYSNTLSKMIQPSKLVECHPAGDLLSPRELGWKNWKSRKRNWKDCL